MKSLIICFIFPIFFDVSRTDQWRTPKKNEILNPFFKKIDPQKISKIDDQTDDRPNKSMKRPSYVPREILAKLKEVKNVNDFQKLFKMQGSTRELANSFTSSFPGAEDFGCKPRPKIVEIPVDFNAVYYPSCVKIDQCGGCCYNTHHMQCVPSVLTNKSSDVFRIPFDGGPPTAHRVYMLHHSQCKCACKVKATDCLPTQTYDEGNCQCQCKREQEKCPSGKQWSNYDCKCVCSRKYTCPKRYIWNDNTCKCECGKKKCRQHYKLDPQTCRCVFFFPGYNRPFGK